MRANFKEGECRLDSVAYPASRLSGWVTDFGDPKEKRPVGETHPSVLIDQWLSKVKCR
jgi:hypothetical protein